MDVILMENIEENLVILDKNNLHKEVYLIYVKVS